MDTITIILKAAKAAHVSGILLLAICGHESNNFTLNYSPNDNGSPSYGICQLKENTARMLKFKGKTSELMNRKVNATYAAKYLEYQQNRYEMNENMNSWCVLTAAYNSGTYRESKYPGYPRNIKYVRLVQRKLPEEFKDRLNCGNQEVAETDE